MPLKSRHTRLRHLLHHLQNPSISLRNIVSQGKCHDRTLEPCRHRRAGLEAAAAQYRTTLGADVGAPQDEPDHGVTVVFITLPNTKIELLYPLGDNSPI